MCIKMLKNQYKMHVQSPCFANQTHVFFTFSFPSPSSLLFPQLSRTY